MGLSVITNTKWANKKSGAIYTAEGFVTNATNGDLEGVEMVLYHNENNERFVRESSEFFEKFDPWVEPVPKRIRVTFGFPRGGPIETGEEFDVIEPANGGIHVRDRRGDIKWLGHDHYEVVEPKDSDQVNPSLRKQS